ncbi:MAG: glycoside hydrolase [Caldithrix sp. RBG_13_44_9]|nr:MAG: glycoside hydrolase [Caldithrix sp. RBG_13_44_9]
MTAWSVIIFQLILLSCTQEPPHVVKISGKNITVYFNDQLHSQVTAQFDQKNFNLGDFAASEFVKISGSPVTDFKFMGKQLNEIQDEIGKGTQVIINGEAGSLQKSVQITTYDDFPAMAVYSVQYTNRSGENIQLDSWTNNHYLIKTTVTPEQAIAFWSFQSGSYESRPDWVLPLKSGFSQENYMGMNASDYGGGTPVVDVWKPEIGIGVGHLEMVPKLVSLPVAMPDNQTASLGVEYRLNQVLPPGESFRTFKTFVMVHQGDNFTTLTEYRRFMIKQGIRFDMAPETSYEPIWCAWGFQRNFTMKQIYDALPKVKELGYKWAVLDDGWQTSEGDWYLVKSKFPKGDADMKKLVDQIHSYGLGAQLWWAPLAVDPGTDLIKDHPDYLLMNEDGSYQKISWWDSYYLCPAYAPVQDYTRKLVETFMKTWDWDGLKIDGQHLNAAPPCYNPAHNHVRPEEGFEKIPEFFKVIYETAMAIKPKAVIEICPCGTAYAFHTMPYMNQSVASDPTSSWQIRLKGKTLQALMAGSAAYFGDHVELSDDHNDFASQLGIGGGGGTKFTWPAGSTEKERFNLSPEKEKIWKKWLDLYLDKMLSNGVYRGELYDLGFDRPETHAIQKDKKMYYAFYGDAYQGTVELRGLENRAYQLMDYENQVDLGTVQGSTASIQVDFKHHLLISAEPK